MKDENGPTRAASAPLCRLVALSLRSFIPPPLRPSDRRFVLPTVASSFRSSVASLFSPDVADLFSAARYALSLQSRRRKAPLLAKEGLGEVARRVPSS